MTKILFKNGNVFYHNKLQKLDVLIENDRIAAIAQELTDADEIIDLKGNLLTPGFVDIHVHLREPGFEHKETIATGTNSAKYGGYTHLVAMANTIPCMDDVATIKDFALRVAKDAKVHTYTYEFNHAVRDLKLASEIGNRYHICHISTKETVAALTEARKTNPLVSGEACPHHLILTDDNIKDMNPNYKMNPPLRSKEDLAALIQGINNGGVTVISTDHAPHAIEEKNKPIDKAPFGIIGNQHAFSLMYTYLVKKGLISLEKVLTCMSINPAKIIGIEHDLEVGLKANLAVFDLEEEYVITKESIKSKSINTPFLETKCFGALKYHVLDGKVTKI